MNLRERLADPRAARPVDRERRALGQRLVGVARAHGARDVGEPRSEQEGRDAARFAERVQEMQEQARVLAHRAGNVAERHHRRGTLAGAAKFQIDRAARLQRTAEAAPGVDAKRRGEGGEAPGAAPVVGHDQRLDQLARLLDLGRAHLGEVLRPQDLLLGHGEAGVEIERGDGLRRPAAAT